MRTRGATLLLVALALVCALAGLAGCGSGEGAEGTPANGEALRVGVRSDVVGFGYLNEGTGKYYGLEIDIAEEMADASWATRTVEFVSVTPDSRKDTLAERRRRTAWWPAIPSPSRAVKNFDFSPSYYTDRRHRDGGEQLARVGRSMEQLKGLTVGTMAGSNTAPQLRRRSCTELGRHRPGDVR